MKLQLKEDPKEWLKFTIVMCVMAGVVAFLLFRRKVLPANATVLLALLLAAIVLTCAVRPRWFRGFYRAGTTASFHVGKIMGGVLLTLFFLLVLTPLGLLLRLLGKDLLALKRRKAGTYWHPAKSTTRFDRQF